MISGMFYLVSFLMLGFANMMILSNYPVRSVLSLIGCFLCASILWILLDAEFLALMLIFVYIGAVMTLFLFVVMMLNLDKYVEGDEFSLQMMVLVLFFTFFLPVGGLFYYLGFKGFFTGGWRLPALPSDYNNVKVLGQVLYTDYVWPFEIIGMILLTAMLAAVGLVFRGSRQGSKKQNIKSQMDVKKSDRIVLIDSKRKS